MNSESYFEELEERANLILSSLYFCSGKTKLSVNFSDSGYGFTKSIDIVLQPDYPKHSKMSLYLSLNFESFVVRVIDLTPCDSSYYNSGFGSLLFNTGIAVLNDLADKYKISQSLFKVIGECEFAINGGESNERRKGFWGSFGFIVSNRKTRAGHNPMSAKLTDLVLKKGVTKNGSEKIIPLSRFLDHENIQLSAEEIHAIHSFKYKLKDLVAMESEYDRGTQFRQQATKTLTLMLRSTLFLIFISLIYFAIKIDFPSQEAFATYSFFSIMLLFGFWTSSQSPTLRWKLRNLLTSHKKSEEIFEAYRQKRKALEKYVFGLERKYNGLLWRLTTVIEHIPSTEREKSLIHYSREHTSLLGNRIDEYLKLFEYCRLTSCFREL